MDKTWKKLERRTAKRFGAKRNPLSGSRSRHTSGDVIHPQIYFECKWRKHLAVLSWFKEIAQAARIEKKIPVLILKSKDYPRDCILLEIKELEKVARCLR